MSGYPTIYVVDADGIIRYRDLRGEELEKAVMGLIAEAKGEVPKGGHDHEGDGHEGGGHDGHDGDAGHDAEGETRDADPRRPAAPRQVKYGTASDLLE